MRNINKSLEDLELGYEDQTPKQTINEKIKKSLWARESYHNKESIEEHDRNFNKMMKSVNKDKSARSIESLKHFSRGNTSNDSPINKAIDLKTPEAFFDWNLKKNFIQASEKKHQAQQPQKNWERLRSMKKTFRSRILQREFFNLLEEKLREGNLDDEEEKHRKNILEHEDHEIKWRRDIERNPEKDHFDLELVESFDHKTIKEKFKKGSGKAFGYLVLIKNLLKLYCKIITCSRTFKFLSIVLICLSLVNIPKKIGIFENNEFLDSSVLLFFWSEMFMKIIAQGLFAYKKGYFSKGWNILDSFLNILSLVFRIFLKDFRINFSVLRALRILRMIKWDQLQRKMKSLIEALPLLFSTFKIVFFFQIFISLVGLNLFSGIMKQRCINPESGKITEQELTCGYKKCSEGLICAKVLFNPEWDTNSFDTLDSSLMQVIRVLGAENWDYALQLVNRAMSAYVFPYYLSIVFIGNYVLLHLILAVLKVKFSEGANIPKKNGKGTRLAKLNYRLLKSEGYSRDMSWVQLAKFKDSSFKSLTKMMSNIITKYSIPKKKGIRQNQMNPVLDQYSPLRKRSLFERLKLVNRIKGKKKRSDANDKHFLLLDLDGSFEKSSAQIEESKGKNIRFYKMLKHKSQLSPSDVIFILKKLRIPEDILINKIVDNRKGLSFFKVQVKQDIVFKSNSEGDVLDENIRNEQRHGSVIKRLVKGKKLLRVFYDIKDESIELTKDKIHSNKPKPSSQHRNSARIPLRSSVTFTSFQATKKIFLKDLPSLRSPRRMNSPSRLAQRMRKGKSFIRITDSNIFWTYEEARKLIMEDLEENNSPSRKELVEEESEAKDIYISVLNEDIRNSSKCKFTWSGNEVIEGDVSYKKTVSIFNSLNLPNKDIWIRGFFGKVIYVKKLLRNLVSSEVYRLIFRLLILFNIGALSLRGIISDEDVLNLNKIASLLFSVEISIRFCSFGLRIFFKYFLNILDLFLLTYMIIDIVLRNNFKAYNRQFVEEGYGLRFFKSLDSILVFRIIHLLLEINYVHFIIGVIRRTLPNFLVVALIYLFTLLLYALFGMSMFQNRFDLNTLEGKEKNFETFWWAFVSALKVSIFDDSYVFVMLGAKEPGKLISFLYVFLGVYILHFVMLKLFCAVMLDGFESNIKEEIEEEELEELEEGKILANDSSPISPASLKIKEPLVKSPLESPLMKSLPTKSPNDKMLKFSFKDAIQSLGTPIAENFEEVDVIEERSPDDKRRRVSGSLKNNAKLNRKDSASILNPLHHKIYLRIPSTLSLFIFSKDNTVRRLLFRMINHPSFIFLTRTMILLSCINMSFETFVDDDEYKHLREYSINLNMIINYFFTFEAFVNIVSHGFLTEKGAYMRNLLNLLDFMASISFFLDIFTDDEDYPTFRVNIIFDNFYRFCNFFQILKSLNLLRISRPLSLILDKTNISTFFNVLTGSFREFADVILIVFIVWLFFGNLGMTLFRGKLGYCEDPLAFEISRDKCGDDQWVVHPNNFENIYNTLYFLMVLSTFDGWGPLLAITANGDYEKSGPSYLTNQYTAFLYFLCFCIIGTWFFLNLFIGVIFSNFILAQKRAQHPFLSEIQMAWTELQTKILKLKITFRHPPASHKRKIVFFFLRSKFYRVIIKSSFIVSFIMLGLNHDMAEPSFKWALDLTSICLCVIYLAEMVLKLVAYTPLGYVSRKENLYEAFTLTAYILHTLIFFQKIENEYVVRCIKAMRVLSVGRILNEIRGIENVLLTLLSAMPFLINIVSLGLVIFFCYAIIGCALFHDVKTGDIIDEYTNFDTVVTAMISLFRCSTSDDWNPIMFDCIKVLPNCISGKDCGSRWAPLYFISFIILINHIVINIFILIILEQFENLYKNPNNPLLMFKQEAKHFEKVWTYFSDDENRKQMDVRVLPTFLRAFKSIIGIPDTNELGLAKEIMKLKLICNDDKVYYNEVYYVLLRRYFRQDLFHSSTTRAKNEIYFFEQKFFLKMEELKISEGNKSPCKPLNNMKETNILPLYFTTILILRTWVNFAREGKAEKKFIVESNDETNEIQTDEMEKRKIRLQFLVDQPMDLDHNAQYIPNTVLI